jgi:hypothetical protein
MLSAYIIRFGKLFRLPYVTQLESHECNMLRLAQVCRARIVETG